MGRQNIPHTTYHIRHTTYHIPHTNVYSFKHTWEPTLQANSNFGSDTPVRLRYSSSAQILQYHIPHTTYHIPHTTYHIPHTKYHIPHTTYHIPHTTYHIPHTH